MKWVAFILFVIAATSTPVQTVHVKGGPFQMGKDNSPYPVDGEGPVRTVHVPAFHMDAALVTLGDFGQFIDATHYTTDAQRYGWSFCFRGFMPHAVDDADTVHQTPWWVKVDGADWKHPWGPGIPDNRTLDHPVTHVSYQDALAYCGWLGKRLLSEEDWEKASRGGLVQQDYPWGNTFKEAGGPFLANIWTGQFPHYNNARDGYRYTSPVHAYPPNALGMYDAVGNVWEWTTGLRENGDRYLRGGSHMCHRNHCFRYRTTARIHVEPDTTAGHTGFRCARNSPVSV